MPVTCSRCGARVYLVGRAGRRWYANTLNGRGPSTWHSLTCAVTAPSSVSTVTARDLTPYAAAKEQRQRERAARDAELARRYTPSAH